MASQPTNYKSLLRIYSKLPAPAIQQTLSASLPSRPFGAHPNNFFFLRRRLGFLPRLSTCVPHAGPHLRSPASPAWRISSATMPANQKSSHASQYVLSRPKPPVLSSNRCGSLLERVVLPNQKSFRICILVIGLKLSCTAKW